MGNIVPKHLRSIPDPTDGPPPTREGWFAVTLNQERSKAKVHRAYLRYHVYNEGTEHEHRRIFDYRVECRPNFRRTLSTKLHVHWGLGPEDTTCARCLASIPKPQGASHE